MTKYRVVLDTNVCLSAIIFGGNARHILDLIINGQVSSFISPAIVLEISQKLKLKFNWNKNQIITVIKTLGKTLIVVKPTQKLNVVKADSTDNKIIEAAVAANVNFIISGDKHLLNLKKYQNVKILSPADFLSIFSNPSSS